MKCTHCGNANQADLHVAHCGHEIAFACVDVFRCIQRRAHAETLVVVTRALTAQAWTVAIEWIAAYHEAVDHPDREYGDMRPAGAEDAGERLARMPPPAAAAAEILGCACGRSRPTTLDERIERHRQDLVRLAAPCPKCASGAAAEDVMRRREAAVREREVSADNVRRNADEQAAKAWRQYMDARDVLAALVSASTQDTATWIVAQDSAKAFLVRPSAPSEPLDGI